MEEKRRKKILLIEDNREIREGVSQLLEMEGYQVVSVASGREGLERLQDVERPHLVVLDFVLPELGGPEFLEAKERLPDVSEIPLLVFSADLYVEKKVEGRAVSGVIRKPLDLD